ncbi:MAG: anti-sigma regulatory factor [Acidimicrobiia bacterium]
MPEIIIAANDEAAIVTTRGAVRELARSVGFGTVDQTKLATAVSEIVRNVVLYAKRGQVVFVICESSYGGRGLEVVIEDEGPGIENLEVVLDGGYSTSGGFGRGISGARALVDEFRLESEPGSGTRVEMRKWL